MTERIPPTSDLAFRKILASPENRDVLQGIIGDFFEIRPAIEDITIANTYDIKAYREYLSKTDGTKKPEQNSGKQLKMSRPILKSRILSRKFRSGQTVIFRKDRCITSAHGFAQITIAPAQ